MTQALPQVRLLIIRDIILLFFWANRLIWICNLDCFDSNFKKKKSEWFVTITIEIWMLMPLQFVIFFLNSSFSLSFIHIPIQTCSQRNLDSCKTKLDIWKVYQCRSHRFKGIRIKQITQKNTRYIMPISSHCVFWDERCYVSLLCHG